MAQIALNSLLILVVVCFMGCGKKKSDFKKQEIPFPRLVQEWKPFVSKEGRFSILFPNTPIETNTVEQTPVGEIEIHTFVVQENIQNSYNVMYFEMPTNIIFKGADWIFDQGISALQKNGYKIDFQREQKSGQFVGREIQVSRGNYKVAERMFIAGTRHYQILSSFATNNPHPEDLAIFFNSFSLEKN